MNSYRALHTSDWHIGKKIGHFSRIDEQQKFLNFLLEFVKNEKIDLLLIAGDIYDSKRPGLEEQKLINDFFYELSFTSCKWCVLIAGNHDKKEYFSINKKIFSRFNFFLITEDELVDQVIFLKDGGDVQFIIVCIPHINERLILNQDYGDMELNSDVFLRKLEYAYRDKIANIVNSLDDKYHSVPKILIAHSFFCSRRSVSSIGNSSILPVSVFGDSFSYVALGHLHDFRKLKANVVYSGSPIQYSFDENKRKYINILLFNDSKLVSQDKVLLPVFGELHFLQGSFNEVVSGLYKIKRKLSCLCYLKIELKERIEAEFEEQIYSLAKSSLIKIFDIYYQLLNLEENSAEQGKKLISKDEVLSRDEKYFFQEKLKRDIINGFRRGSRFKEEELIALFEEILLKGRAGEYENK
ncbi:nuclease SbcCD subunit D [Borrelia turcica IST7]|uniref:Nuclease SbcCD subunit D n=1 Tax=Borrelia turcica IST7 TaxID=1104446 RepID=A0A386PM36_9SPIR|nr:exonuclease subunit SbcD [Borrelia turcica]AYE36674.1 nuclease SbcCD subunit D [Borrelia turcica IST7]